jgi:hypothetical protein
MIKGTRSTFGHQGSLLIDYFCKQAHFKRSVIITRGYAANQLRSRLDLRVASFKVSVRPNSAQFFILPYYYSSHKCSHRISSTTHFSLMRPFIVIVEKPSIELILWLVVIRKGFLPKSCLIEFSKDRFVETFTELISLW